MKTIGTYRAQKWEFGTKRMPDATFTIMVQRKTRGMPETVVMTIEEGGKHIAQWFVNYLTGETMLVKCGIEDEGKRAEAELYLRYEIRECFRRLVDKGNIEAIVQNFRVPSKAEELAWKS